MSRRNRPRHSNRIFGNRERKPLVLVFCEGSVTEPNYLEAFSRANIQARVELKIATAIGVPKTLVDLAKAAKKDAEKRAKTDENYRYDAIWCVFDVDDHPLVHEARQTAVANGIQLAVSNPSFELWLLLHFREQPGMQHRDQIRRMLQAEAPGYDKRLPFDQVQFGYSAAVTRALRLEQAAEAAGEPGRNPTTGVYRLTESIRSGDASGGVLTP